MDSTLVLLCARIENLASGGLNSEAGPRDSNFDRASIAFQIGCRLDTGHSIRTDTQGMPEFRIASSREGSSPPNSMSFQGLIS